MDAHILLSPVGQKTETRFNCFLTENRKSTEMVGTPSTVCTNSFHRCGGPPPSKREVLGLRRSRPPALPSIAYRGFAVAPMTLRAPSRNLVYNPGSRVATLVVSKGVMGFLAERVHSFHRCGGPHPSKREVWGFAGQGLRPCRRLHIGALRSPLSPFARPLEAFYTTPGAGSQPCSFQRRLWGS